MHAFRLALWCSKIENERNDEERSTSLRNSSFSCKGIAIQNNIEYTNDVQASIEVLVWHLKVSFRNAPY